MNTTVADFVRQASTEICPHDEELLESLQSELPAGTTLYVAHTPRAQLQDVVRVAVKAQSLGFRASPHIVARRIPGAAALKAALDTLRDAGVRQMLLVAGDLQRPVGEFTSTLQILETGLLENSGMEQVGIAGHPDGHPAVGSDALFDALRCKQDFAARSGIAFHIVTQFGFDPEAICAWDERMTGQGIRLPVHVGIPGPTPLAKLVKFALQCGVGASLSSLVKNVGSMTNLARLATAPDEMLLGLIRGRANGSRLVQPHFYAFGGTMATARWLRAVADGSFTVHADGRKFVVNAR
jgi:methylenetetrahydrofolate reductase (NADPH)